MLTSFKLLKRFHQKNNQISAGGSHFFLARSAVHSVANMSRLSPAAWSPPCRTFSVSVAVWWWVRGASCAANNPHEGGIYRARFVPKRCCRLRCKNKHGCVWVSVRVFVTQVRLKGLAGLKRLGREAAAAQPPCLNKSAGVFAHLINLLVPFEGKLWRHPRVWGKLWNQRSFWRWLLVL